MLVLWFDITHTTQTKTHSTFTGQKGDTSINTTCYCAHCSCLYYFEWAIGWYQKKYLSTMPLLFKTHSLVEVINLLIRFNKTKFLPWNTKNTDRNGVNRQNRYIYTHEKVLLGHLFDDISGNITKNWLKCILVKWLYIQGILIKMQQFQITFWSKIFCCSNPKSENTARKLFLALIFLFLNFYWIFFTTIISGNRTCSQLCRGKWMCRMKLLYHFSILLTWVKSEKKNIHFSS